MKKINLNSSKATGFTLLVLGIAQMLLNNKKEVDSRNALKDELKEELMSELINK